MGNPAGYWIVCMLLLANFEKVPAFQYIKHVPTSARPGLHRTVCLAETNQKRVVVVGGTGRVGGSAARWILEFGQKEGLDVNVVLCGRDSENYRKAKERIVGKAGKDKEPRISFQSADFEKASELQGIILVKYKCVTETLSIKET